MFLLRNYSLKSKQLGGWFSFLPSIRDLDHMGVRLLGAGSAILAIALLACSNDWLRDTAVGQSTKIRVTFAVCTAAATAFGLRLRGVLLAKRFAWTCLILFIAAMLSLFVVERSRHAAAAAGASAAVARPARPAT